MTNMRHLAAYALFGIVGALLTWALVPTSDSLQADVDNSAVEQSSQLAPSDSGIVSSRVPASVDVQPDLVARRSAVDDTEDINAKNQSQVNSFEEYMLAPDARPEAYLVADGALRTDRLQEFRSADSFDDLAAQLGERADAESQERAAKLRQRFYYEAIRSSAFITVSTVSCGSSVCAAKFQGPDASALDAFMTSLRSSGDVPVYAAMEMPAEMSSGLEVRRIIFTTDPAVNAFEFPL